MRKWAVIVTTVLLWAWEIHGVAAGSHTIYMSQTVPYSDSKLIARAILDECPLPQQQAELIEAVAKTEGITITRDDEAVKAGKGQVLYVEITNAISMGNPFMGHQKRISIKGNLRKDGTEIGSFSGVRSSMGGAFAGFKGSCSVLGRCLKALAGDVTRWLKNPTIDSRIGE